MEGPTPVSALIHAATMVTAGVYLIVRTHPLFELAPQVQDLAAGLGAATLLMAGLIALVQTDIKRVIAYSTMSQIGYMFLGAGLGAYANAMFHLMTHAFFKALLFLAAGIVIHALAGEQDIRKMGGLRQLMPKTWWAMLVGGLALAGLPPLSGFFSKDSILASALDRGWYGDVLFGAGMAGTFLTGLYTFRMLFIVFGGEQSAYVQEHPPHAHGDRVAQWSMGLAVAALAVLAAVGGLAPVRGRLDARLQLPRAGRAAARRGERMAGGVREHPRRRALGLAGIAVAWWIYSARRASAPKPSRVLEHKFYFDELYNVLFYWPAVGLSHALYALVEGPLVGGSIAAVSQAARWGGSRARDLQTGLVRTYAFALAAGLADPRPRLRGGQMNVGSTEFIKERRHRLCRRWSGA